MKTVKDTIKQITLPTPYAVGDVHVYLLRGERITLIDAGVKTESAWKQCKKQLNDLGYQPEDVEQIVLTHHHPDHLGLTGYFVNAKTIAAHPKLRPWLEKDEKFLTHYQKFLYHLYEESGVPKRYNSRQRGDQDQLRCHAEAQVTHSLQEGDLVPGHEDWITIETPGHAQSHISFFRQSDGAFIGGDHLLAHISPNPLLEPPFKEGEERPRPLLQYRESLEKLWDLSIQKVYPGHGEVFEHTHDLIACRLKKQEERAEKVYRMFEEQPLSAYQVCKHLFPKQIENQFHLTMSETIGQLDYLEYTTQIQSMFEGERKLYYVNR